MACVHVSGLGCFRLLGMLSIAYGKKICVDDYLQTFVSKSFLSLHRFRLNIPISRLPLLPSPPDVLSILTFCVLEVHLSRPRLLKQLPKNLQTSICRHQILVFVDAPDFDQHPPSEQVFLPPHAVHNRPINA